MDDKRIRQRCHYEGVARCAWCGKFLGWEEGVTVAMEAGKAATFCDKSCAEPYDLKMESRVGAKDKW